MELYELTTAQIIHGATRTLEFARNYAARAHQTQRSGPSYGSFPSVYEVDTMIQIQQHTHEALLKLRTAVLSQEHALAEHRARGQGNGYDEGRGNVYQEELKNNVNTGQPDAKKRRGVSLAIAVIDRILSDILIEGRTAWAMPQLQPRRNT